MTRKPILIVDDEEGIREMLRLAFETYDYPVLLAANGKEALDLLEGAEPGMIVLDLMMPVMDGRRFAAALARGPVRLSRIPIVVITAYPGEARTVIPDAVILEKPVDLEHLLLEAKVHCG